MAEIRMTEHAVTALRQVVEREGGDRALRIYVDHHCHCGGSKYGMALGAPGPDETELEVSGIRVSVSPEVASAAGHAEIDYIQTMLQSGFTLTNSEHSCGGGMGHRD